MTKAENIQEIVDNRLKVPNGFFKWAGSGALCFYAQLLFHGW